MELVLQLGLADQALLEIWRQSREQSYNLSQYIQINGAFEAQIRLLVQSTT